MTWTAAEKALAARNKPVCPLVSLKRVFLSYAPFIAKPNAACALRFGWATT